MSDVFVARRLLLLIQLYRHYSGLRDREFSFNRSIICTNILARQPDDVSDIPTNVASDINSFVVSDVRSRQSYATSITESDICTISSAHFVSHVHRWFSDIFPVDCTY